MGSHEVTKLASSYLPTSPCSQGHSTRPPCRTKSVPASCGDVSRQAAQTYAVSEQLPTLLVFKGELKVHADGSATQTPPRLTIDLRKLNPLIMTEFFEMPPLRHMCDKLAASSLHSSFDLTSGYTQAELRRHRQPRLSKHDCVHAPSLQTSLVRPEVQFDTRTTQ